jgi:hypothetical protein
MLGEAEYTEYVRHPFYTDLGARTDFRHATHVQASPQNTFTY